jgi:hypothetical protein
MPQGERMADNNESMAQFAMAQRVQRESMVQLVERIASLSKGLQEEGFGLKSKATTAALAKALDLAFKGLDAMDWNYEIRQLSVAQLQKMETQISKVLRDNGSEIFAGEQKPGAKKVIVSEEQSSLACLLGMVEARLSLLGAGKKNPFTPAGGIPQKKGVRLMR